MVFLYIEILNYYTPSNPLLPLSVINDLFSYLFFIFKGSTVIKATENSRDWYFEKKTLENEIRPNFSRPIYCCCAKHFCTKRNDS